MEPLVHIHLENDWVFSILSHKLEDSYKEICFFSKGINCHVMGFDNNGVQNIKDVHLAYLMQQCKDYAAIH